MNTEVSQDVLFQDPIGLRLRLGREKAGLSLEAVGQQLRLPVAIVQAMESDDWERLGAPVYVRSYLGSYLRLVGLPSAIAEEVAQTKPVPPLVVMASSSRFRRAFQRVLRNGVYLLMTGALVVPVYWAARQYQESHRPQVATLDSSPEMVEAQALAAGAMAPLLAQSPDSVASVAADDGISAAGVLPPTVEPSAAHAPVMASLGSFSNPAGPSAALVLRFNGESWLDVLDAQGARVERGLVEAGAERRYAPGQVARITLGNASAVDVSVAGKAVDLSAYRTANVARFTVSSSGEPAPAGN